MARFLRLRVRPGTGLFTAGAQPGRSFDAGDEFVVRYEEAAALLRDKGRRGFEIVDDFEDDSGLVEPDVELPNKPG